MRGAETDDLTARAQGRLGTVLRGKYRLDSVLGVGGMAVVFKATHRNQAEFAVKMLHPELSMRQDVRTRFLREGYASNSVKHPGAVLVVDDDVAEDGAAFLVMELLQGVPVENLWERSHYRLPVKAVLTVADQLLDVLSAAHAKGIIHRDIKPANLFAVRDGTLKVLDFGIARVRDAAATEEGSLVTKTGVLLGTPAFMAPEQAASRASKIDAQTDVWAVGATLFTLLTGHPVHEAPNAAQLVVRAATTQARLLASVVLDVPPVVARVIDRALALEKEARWSSAAAMRQAVAEASVEVFGTRPSHGALATLMMIDDAAYAATQPGQIILTPPEQEGVMSTVEVEAPARVVPRHLVPPARHDAANRAPVRAEARVKRVQRDYPLKDPVGAQPAAVRSEPRSPTRRGRRRLVWAVAGPTIAVMVLCGLLGMYFLGTSVALWLRGGAVESSEQSTVWSTPTRTRDQMPAAPTSGVPVAIPIADLPAAPGVPKSTDDSQCTLRSFVDESGIKRFVKECP